MAASVSEITALLQELSDVTHDAATMLDAIRSGRQINAGELGNAATRLRDLEQQSTDMIRRIKSPGR